MQINEVAVAAVVTVGIAGASYAAFNSDVLVRRTEIVADAADCRTVDSAIAAYAAAHGVTPTTIDQIKPYVRGDLSKYRIVTGKAAGPGCPA